MTTTLPFARTIDLEPVPAGKHLVAFADEQRAAREEKEISSWQPPQPKPEPEIVRLRREAAAKMAQEAAQATQAAAAADESATQLKNAISLAEVEVKQLEFRLSKLEAQDFAKQAADARTAIKASIENCDAADPTRGVDRATLLILRAPEFQKMNAEAVKETKAALAVARKNLADLTESK